MPPIEASAASEATQTTARQSSQLLKLLRSVTQGSTRDLRRYLARGGDPHARVYADEKGKFWASPEEYTGPGDLIRMSLLTMCCLVLRTEQIASLLAAGADPNNDAGTIQSPMCAAALLGDLPTMTVLASKGARIDGDGCTPLAAASQFGQLEAVQ